MDENKITPFKFVEISYNELLFIKIKNRLFKVGTTQGLIEENPGLILYEIDPNSFSVIH